MIAVTMLVVVHNRSNAGRRLVLLAVLALASACGGSHSAAQEDAAVDAAWVFPDCALESDEDRDNISNGHEGCRTAHDTDEDGIPDFVDFDSDNDGLGDQLEAGDDNLTSPPVDTDGDGLPDFRDPDSDDDGLIDGDEDRDHNSMLGQCGKICPELDVQWCGPGQACLPTELCDPPVTFGCAVCESDPHVPDTDGDGILDSDEVCAHICIRQSASNPNGYAPLQRYSFGRFKLATTETTLITQGLVQNTSDERCDNSLDDDSDGLWDCEDPDCAGTDECHGAALALDEPTAPEVAGFAAARATEAASVDEALQHFADELASRLGAGNVIQRSPGIVPNWDDQTVYEVVFGIDNTGGLSASELRRAVVAAFLGQDEAEVQGLPGPTGPTDASMLVSMALVLFPPCWGDYFDHSSLGVMGGITAEAAHGDPASDAAWWLTAWSGPSLGKRAWLNEPRCETALLSFEDPDHLVFTMHQFPIALSLAVAVNDTVLSPSLVNGFFYDVSDGTLHVTGLGLDPSQPAFAVAFGLAVLVLTFFWVTGPFDLSTPWFREGALITQRVLAGEWWRVITAATLHVDAGHALGNAIFLAVLGWAVAERLGGGTMLLLALITAVAGFGVSLLLSGAHSTVGASGGLFGLLGVAAGHGVRGEPDPLGRRRQILRVVGAAVMLLAFTAFSPEANIRAHLGGFGCGLLLGLVLPRRAVPAWAQVLLAGVAVFTVAAGWAQALR